MFYKTFFLFIVLLLTYINCQATVSSDWLPETFDHCSLSRQQVIDNLFNTFAGGVDSVVSVDVLYCVWYNTTIVTDFMKSQVPGGVENIEYYCDGNSDGFLEYDEIINTHSCIGNCNTAIKTNIFYAQAKKKIDQWLPICQQYL